MTIIAAKYLACELIDGEKVLFIHHCNVKNQTVSKIKVEKAIAMLDQAKVKKVLDDFPKPFSQQLLWSNSNYEFELPCNNKGECWQLKKGVIKIPIKTEHVNPPIPHRDFDWLAVRDGYDKGDLIGCGKTEQQAIDNLIEQEQEK